MDFEFIPFDPPSTLRPVLRQTFFARGRIPYRSDKILPNGLVVAIFNLGRPHRVGKSDVAEENPSFSHSWLHGVQTSPVFNTPTADTHVVGLLFEPMGFHAVFGADMRTLTDRTVDARDVVPGDAIDEIVACTANASSPDGHAALHDFVQQRLADPPAAWLQNFYDRIRNGNGALKLAEAYRATGHSARHVNECFKIAVGVGPKVLCRILRLHALLEEVDPAAGVNWTVLAHAFELYDQPHFNREFRKFSGLHPNEYLAQRRRELPALGKGESVSFAPQR